MPLAVVCPPTREAYLQHNVRDHGFDVATHRNLLVDQMILLHSAVHEPELLARMQEIRPALKCPQMEGLTE